MLGNKRIMGDNILYYMQLENIERRDFAKAIGVPYSSLTDWINGKSYPRIDKIEMMARYFGVQKSDLVEDPTIVPTDGQSEPYYVDAETRQLAQELHDDPELSVMLDAYRNLSPRDAKLVMEMVRRMQDEGAD